MSLQHPAYAGKLHTGACASICPLVRCLASERALPWRLGREVLGVREIWLAPPARRRPHNRPGPGGHDGGGGSLCYAFFRKEKKFFLETAFCNDSPKLSSDLLDERLPHCSACSALAAALCLVLCSVCCS